LETEVADPDIWNNPEEAAEKQKRLADIKEEIEIISTFQKRVKEVEEFAEALEDDKEVLREIRERIENLRRDIRKEEFRVFLSGKYDKSSAILEVASGAGGRDAEDFAAMVVRMYERYAEKKGWKAKIISASYGETGGPEGRVGIKSASLEIAGTYAFGILKEESGAHRLVRKSPFSSGGVRHTSFVQVEVFPKIKEREGSGILRDEDLKVDTFRASGPGGQHVNRRETAVRITHLPTNTVASSQSERVQGENKKIAMDILRSKLLQMEEERKKKEVEEAKGENFGSSWGTQIRNYVLHPYKIVKDLRTQKETSNVEEVLEGDLDLIKNDFFQ